jgi:FKBP-type peptidyl-prolyl cis-trans isomerase
LIVSIELSTEEQKTSYALGLDVGMSFVRLPLAVELEAFFEGVTNVFKGQPLKLDQDEFKSVMQAFQQKMQAHAEAQKAAAGEGHRAAGEKFLAENKEKDGVVVTESGLQYIVLEEGDGPKPSATDKVKVHYQGTLLDGTEFDSSIKRGEPAVFPVNAVIPGWTEALQLMQVGSKYQLFIPSGLAYGANGAGQAIGPHATLIFEVELLGIES